MDEMDEMAAYWMNIAHSGLHTTDKRKSGYHLDLQLDYDICESRIKVILRNYTNTAMT